MGLFDAERLMRLTISVTQTQRRRLGELAKRAGRGVTMGRVARAAPDKGLDAVSAAMGPGAGGGRNRAAGGASGPPRGRPVGGARRERRGRRHHRRRRCARPDRTGGAHRRHDESVAPDERRHIDPRSADAGPLQPATAGKRDMRSRPYRIASHPGSRLQGGEA